MDKTKAIEVLRTFKPLKYDVDIDEKLDLIEAIERAIPEYLEENVLDNQDLKKAISHIIKFKLMLYDIDEEKRMEFHYAILQFLRTLQANSL